MRRVWLVARTLAISVAGGSVAQMFALPAGMLMGGAVAVSIASISGVKTLIPIPLRNCAFVVVGMTLGTNVASNALELISHWPATVLGLALSLLVMVAISTLIMRYAFRFDLATSYLSSFPGHLSFVIALSESGYGNPSHIATIQSVRILLLTISVPILVRLSGGMIAVPGLERVTLEWPVLLMLMAACTVGGFVFRAARMPAAFVLGPMVVATAGKLMGLYEGILPMPLTLIGYVVMGGLIGSRFGNISMQELRRTALAGLVVGVISAVVVSAVCFILGYFVEFSFGQMWLGLAPGALESMGAMGVALGYDTAFIAAHHTMRFFLLTLTIPTVGLLVGRKKDDI